MLYQTELRSLPSQRAKIRRIALNCKPCFQPCFRPPITGGLFEIVNHDLLAIRFERFFNKLNVERVNLILVLRLFAREYQV
jgi:hypothetical protein